MPSIAVPLMSLALLASFLIHSVAPAQETPLSGPSSSPRHTALGLLLRKRTLDAALRGPPTSALLADALMETGNGSPGKRSDDYWIWMPAHGYMPIPRDEVMDSRGGQDSMGNLLRYG